MPSRVPARYASGMSDFDAAFSEFLAEYFAQNPVLATATGEHRHDGASFCLPTL